MQRATRIAIDGPAGAGKSTIGEQLAQRLGYLYVDTGAMYRALTWLALQEGVPLDDGPALGHLAEEARVQISYPQVQDGRQYTVTVRERDVTWAVRDTAVTRAVSQVSSHPEVRQVLIAQQRELARQGKVVMVGRDIGAVVLPDADLKIFLTASLEERARRRHVELVERLGAHNPALPAQEEVLEDVRRRDAVDRKNMEPAPDAILVTTDALNVPQVLDRISSFVEDPA